MNRTPDRIPPLAARLVRVWLANPKKTLAALMQEASRRGEDLTTLDDLTLVQRLEKAYPDA